MNASTNSLPSFNFSWEGNYLRLPIEQGEQLLLKLSFYDSIKDDMVMYSNKAYNNYELYMSVKKETSKKVIKGTAIGAIIGFTTAVIGGVALAIKLN